MSRLKTKLFKNSLFPKIDKKIGQNVNCTILLICYLEIIFNNQLQVALVICGLFICDFAYMPSKNDLFSGTYPLIISHPWSFYMRIHYMRVYFWSPYLSHITRSNCTLLSQSLTFFHNFFSFFYLFNL